MRSVLIQLLCSVFLCVFRTLTVPCSEKVWQGLAAADAFAAGDICGIGGFIRSPSGETHWFSERYSRQQFCDLNIDLETDLQKSITSMETLAQIAILWISCRIYPGHRIPITLPSFSDNTGAESGSNRLFSTKKPQCWFLEIVSSFNYERYGSECKSYCRTYQC